MIDTISIWLEPWAVFYADHAAFSTGVIAVHILSIFVGGGMAIGADRAILRSPAGSADAARAVVSDLATTHTVVIGALVITVTSGLALLASDLATFATSVVYWVKMTAFVALMLNGLAMRRAEHAVLTTLDGAPVHTAEMPVPFPVHVWKRVRRTALVSFALWLSIVVLGVVLSNN